jgi:hypothetical protein
MTALALATPDEAVPFEDVIADDLREMAGKLLSPHSGAFRTAAIAYLAGDAATWGESGAWALLPREARDAMKGAACDLVCGMPAAEQAAAERLIRTADLIESLWTTDLDPEDFSLRFHPAHEGVA